MDVDLNEDQVMLQDMTRRFLEERAPIGALRKAVDGGAAIDRALWREAAELGWVALFVPEEYGGIAEAAGGVMDAAIVAEELGRVVFAGPFLSTCVVAMAIAGAGSAAQKQQWLPGLASGELLGAWAGAEGLTATRAGDGYVIDGTAAFVQDAAVADVLLVTAMSEQGPVQLLLPKDADGVAIEALESLDLGRRLANVHFTKAPSGTETVLNAHDDVAAQVERQFQAACALQCAETVGVTDRALEFTLAWCQQRYAFGRPIGSYQALKHRLADHAAQLEGAKAAAAHAARSVAAQAPDAAIAVSIAKSHIGRTSSETLRDCIQLHGGIGLTWDHDLHFYARRAVSNEMLWGTPAMHHERLCRLAGL